MYPNQLPIFKELAPYTGGIDEENRWIKLAQLVPWDEIEGHYRSAFAACKQSVLKPGRLILGLWLGQMLMNLSDRDIVEYFHENPYFQFFCGQDSFVARKEGTSICHPSLLSKRRKRLGAAYVDQFQAEIADVLKAKGLIVGNKLMLDATVFPANIGYPNDVKLLNTTREWLCETILRVKNVLNPEEKVRTYRRVARRVYCRYCKVKRKHQTLIRKTTKQMIRYTSRNIRQLEHWMDQLHTHKPALRTIRKTSVQSIQSRLDVAKTIVEQQMQRVTTRGRHIADRIVSLQQPQVRPVVRGKDGKAVEFGPKSHISLVDGFAFLDVCQFSPFNEGIRLAESLDFHRKRFDQLPSELMADQIYANRANRAYLSELQIEHSFPAIGRPPNAPDQAYKRSKADTRKRQRKRNHIEGVFGVLKEHFRLDKIRWTVPDGHLMQIQLGLAAFNLKSALAKA